MLHILRCSPWHCDINSLFRILHTGDDLLLIQDGVLAGVNGNHFIKIFIDNPIDIYALKNDIEARGLTKQISAKINIIDYIDFVNLSIKQNNQMNW